MTAPDRGGAAEGTGAAKEPKRAAAKHLDAEKEPESAASRWLDAEKKPAETGNERTLPDSYVAVDLETTGLNPKTDKIIEIAAIKVTGGRIAEEKTTFVNPHQLLDERITGLTGIEDAMLTDAPDIGQVIGEYVEFTDGLPLLGHNILFDYSFLKHAAVNCGLEFERKGLDTLRLCRAFMPEELSKSLGPVCAYFQVGLKCAHRAMGDAQAAHALYQAIRARYGETDGGADAAKLFFPQPLIYRVKKEQPASKRQKEVLRELAKYHRIDLTVDIDYLSRNETSRLTDKIIAQYRRIRRNI